MPTYTVLSSARVHGLVNAAREFKRSLAALHDRADSDGFVNSLFKTVDAACALRAEFALIEDLQVKIGTIPGNGREPFVTYGLGDKGGKLAGFEAIHYLAQVDLIKDLVSELFERWGLSRFVLPDGGVDRARVYVEAPEIPEPACHREDLAKIDGILEAIDIPGAVPDLREKLPDWPLPAGVDSPPLSKVLGATFYYPGEPKRTEADDPEVGVYDIGGRLIELVGIAGQPRWRLDRPYALVVEKEGDRPHLHRCSRNAEMHDWHAIEYRFVIRAADGRYFLFGAPPEQWYRDRVFLPDGTAVLSQEPRGDFHGDICLVRAADRRLCEIERYEGAKALVESGHTRDLPDDLRESLSLAESEPNQPIRPTGPVESEKSAEPVEHSLSDELKQLGSDRAALKKIPRDQGKMNRCRGIYVAALDRNEVPPTAAEIARMVGCNRGTATRAIAPWEAK
jgi:hypothetical protein